MVNPVPGYSITTAFWKVGKLWSLGHHTGTDISGSGVNGKPIVAGRPGKVVAANAYDKSYGYKVIIQVGSEQDWYCHMPKNAAKVKVGQMVSAGQVIGKVGAVGNVTGPHLHLERRASPYTFKASTFKNPSAIIDYRAKAPVPVWGKPETWEVGGKSADVTKLGERLVVHAKAAGLPDPYKAGPGPTFTETDRAAVAAFQKRQGWKGAAADGLPGAQTFKLLAATPPAKPVTPAKPKTVEVVSAIQNMAGNNVTGIRTAKSRMAEYVDARKGSPVNIINAQETTVASTVRPRLDSGLKPLGYTRAPKGGEGRYQYTRGVKVIASGLFTVPSKYWFLKDDKQAAWVAYEIDGAKGLDVSMHLEYRSGKAADAKRVEQAVWIAHAALAKAAELGINLRNVMLTGDTNSNSQVIKTLIEAGWLNVAAGSKFEDTHTFMGWDGKSRDRFDYALVPKGAGKAVLEAVAHDTDISDHAGLRVRRELII